MDTRVAIALEIGKRRTFATAVDWPGWSRSGRGPDEALENLLAYADRYRSAAGAALAGVKPRVIETVTGDSGTDFGVPHAQLAADERVLDRPELDRQLALLQAAWDAFDQAAGPDGVLRTGPRGGGRQVAAMVVHVSEAEHAYLGKLGSRPGLDLAESRTRAMGALIARVEGIAVPDPSRAVSLWSPRYYLRRSAWHALDHAWEIEDRSDSLSGRS